MVFFVASACDWPSVLKWKLPIDVRFNWNLTCLDLCKMNLSTRSYHPPLILANPTALGPTLRRWGHIFWRNLFKAKTKVCLAAKVMAGVWKEFPEVSLIPNKIPWWFIYPTVLATGRKFCWRDEVSPQIQKTCFQEFKCIFTINEMSDSISLATSL